MKKQLRIIALLAVMLSLFIVPLCTHADFGDFAGESDYGSSDDSWNSDDDRDSDDNSISNNSRNKKRKSKNNKSRSSEDGGLIEIIIYAVTFAAIIAVLAAAGIIKAKRKKDPYFLRRPRRQKADRHIFLPPTENLKRMTEYDQIDPSFSSADLQKKIADLYVRFQHCWQAKDISELRPYLTDAYFAQIDRQLGSYRDNHQTNCIEDIEVISVQMKGWRKDGHNIEMVAKVETRIVDYVIDDNSGEIIRGSKDKYKLMKYEWTLRSDPAIRASRQSTGTVKKACPDCGAELVINHSGTCPYCGALVTTDSFDWAVCNIKGISQKTKNK